MMVTLCTGSVFGSSRATSAWPDSWYAVLRRSSSGITIERRSAPMMILSLARSKSSISTRRLLPRAANSAASFTRLARSAPEKPGQPRAMMSGFTSGDSGTFRMCTLRISSRPRMSGSGTTTWRSKRPGRSSAGSSTSGRLVAAMTITPIVASKPSISTSSWFSVCSRSSLPPPRPAPRWRPTASISSMKTMHGACFFACSNMSRTRAAPTPTNISTKSEPEMEKNGTLASPAMARASSVLPVPGLPTISTPRGMRPPSFWNLDGSRRKSTSSATSSLASSQPATSAKVTVLVDSSSMRARDLPNENAPPRPPPCIWRMKKIHTPISSSIGNHEMKICISIDCSSSGLVETFTPYFIRSLTIQMSYRPGELTTIWRLSSLVVARMVRPWISTLAISPRFAASMKSEYSIGTAWGFWRVLNWLNTVIRTRPMTSQMTRFFSMLFKYLTPYTAPRKERSCYSSRKRRATQASVWGQPSQLQRAGCNQISLPRFAARRGGLEHFDTGEGPLERFSNVFERLAVESLRQESPVGLERHFANRNRGLEQLEAARLVDVAHAGDVGREVREHEVEPRQVLQDFTEVALQHRHARDRRNRQQVHRGDLRAFLRGDLRPA